MIGIRAHCPGSLAAFPIDHSESWRRLPPTVGWECGGADLFSILGPEWQVGGASRSVIVQQFNAFAK